MSEIQGIVSELQAIHDGNAWHGMSLQEAVEGLSADQAAAFPLAGAHSIWEIVNHMAAWENVWLLRLQGDLNAHEPEEGDFPAVAVTSDAAWKSSLRRLNEIHHTLIEVARGLDEARLESDLNGRDYSHRFLLRGAIRHHVYHAGQIALLRKAFATGSVV